MKLAHKKQLLTITAIIAATALLTLSAKSKQDDRQNANMRTTAVTEHPVLLEIFTSPFCMPVTTEILNEDGSFKEPNATDIKYDKKLPAVIFREALLEDPNIIALHYHYDRAAAISLHLKGEPEINTGHNNTAAHSKIDFSRTNDFVKEQRAQYRKNHEFLEQYTGNTTIINGTYKTDGTIKTIVDAAIQNAEQNQKIHPVSLEFRSNKRALSITFPQLRQTLRQPLTVKLVGYYQTIKKQNFDSFPTLTPTNIVSDYKFLSPWNGSETERIIAIDDMNAESFALIIQHADTNKIMAAGKIEPAQKIALQ